MSNETQHTPADVRGRIIRASILPIEDEETMIARLRAGAEAVERGELDAEDFAGIWSQYLRELFRRASSVPAPADVRELAVEIIRSLDLIARNYDSYEYGLPVMTHYDEMVDTVVALLRAPRGERPAGPLDAAEWADLDEAVPLPEPLTDAERAEGLARIRADRMWRTPRGEGERGLIMRAMLETFPWSPDIRQEYFERAADEIIAALRSEAQGEEDVGEVCHLCGEMFDPSEFGTVTGPLGQDDGVPRWYRCPRCARAYAAGYQQGQRDPRGDETADPTALRSEAQGDAEALAALVVRIWTRCQNEGPNYRETDEFWADFERAYQLVARRGEGGGDGD